MLFLQSKIVQCEQLTSQVKHRLATSSCTKRKIIIKGQLGIGTSRAWCWKINLSSDEIIPGVGNKNNLNSASQNYIYCEILHSVTPIKMIQVKQSGENLVFGLKYFLFEL